MEENNRKNMDELVKLILNIDNAMGMTREKQTLIDNMKKELMEETRPMMVEQRKTEIANKEQEKTEFDEMTKNALIRAKKEIHTMREKSEKEYQEKLLETLEKKKTIEKKLELMEKRDLTDEKLAMARNSAEKALTKVNEEMKEYQEKHFVKRAKLDEFETDINNYALELGIEIEQIRVEEQNTTANPEEPAVEEQNTTANPEEPAVEEQNTTVNPEEPTVEEQETTANLEEPLAGATGVNLTAEQEENLLEENELPKVASVEVKDDKYIITYENKENGIYSMDKKECEKLGFFKGLAERFKIIANRKEYGIDFISAMRADVNIFRNLNDKDKEKYLSYIAGQTAGCFDINYDNPDSRYAKSLAKGQERLALKEAEALEQYGPMVDDHEARQTKYDRMFGEGFDQHDNPPEVSDKATNEEVKKTVRDILYGDIEQDK